MKTVKVENLKKGYGINHPEHGYLQYRGLVTKHPFTEEPKTPHQYLFWQPVDEKGNNQPDIIELNSNLLVELIDEIEETE